MRSLKHLALLDPPDLDHSSSAGVIQLATQLTSFTIDEMDNLSMEFQDFRASSENQLPPRVYSRILSLGGRYYGTQAIFCTTPTSGDHTG